MKRYIQRFVKSRRCLWMGGLLLAVLGAGTTAVQAAECAVAGGSADCPRPITTDFSCGGTFVIADSQPCSGLGQPGPQCKTEGEAIEQAIANYSALVHPCTKPGYGPSCPPAWNPHQVEYELGVVKRIRNAYVARVPRLVDGQCIIEPVTSCGSPDIPNHFYGATGDCSREVTCPPGSAAEAGVCKIPRAKVCPLGNPMNCVTGEKTQVENDIGRAAGPLEFTRYYSSSGFYEPRGTGPQAPEDRNYRILGPNWRHTYQRAIRPEPPVAGQPAMMTVMRPDGGYHYFRQVAGLWVGSKDEPDTLQELLDQSQRVGWRYQSADNAVELYDAQGQLQSISHASGQILTMQYSTVSTPATVAPFEGLLIAVEDSNGRTLQLRYDALARIARVIDAAGNEHAYAYDAAHALTGVTRPDGTTRSYLYNEPAHNLNYYAGTLLTGIVDENGQRYGTYRYSHNRVNEEWHGSSYADRLAITYTTVAGQSVQFARTTGALGNFEQRDLATINGVIKEAGRKRCTTQNCSSVIAESRRSYDANGNLLATVDDRGTTTTYDFNDRGQELVRRENFVQPESCPAPSIYYSSNYGSSCTTGTCWSNTSFPGSSSGAPLGWNGWYYSCLQPSGPATQTRSVETDWHTAFNLPLERRIRNAANALEARTRWAYNARGQVAARCEYDVADAAAMAYACSATADPPAAAKVRRWTYAYCESADVAAPNSTCPVLGYLKSSNGPRSSADPGMNGADDVATRAYYPSTDESGCGTAAGPCHRKGDLWTITNALGQVSEMVAYDRRGQPHLRRDANGTLTRTVYDERGRLSARIVHSKASPISWPDDSVTTFEYDGAGNITRVRPPDGHALQYVYDDAHRLTAIVDAAGNRIRYTLDAAGNRTKVETFDASYDPALPGQGLTRSLAHQYNALSRLVRTLDAANAPTFDATPYDTSPLLDGHDANGNLVQSKDGLNVQTSRSYDALNRLVKTVGDYAGTDPETGDATIEYGYDARNHLLTVKDPGNLTTTYGYDGLGNRISIDSPDTGRIDYAYDRAGNRTGQTDNRGVASTYVYDALNRLRSVTFPGGALDVAFDYDQNNAATGCPASHPQGRLTRMSDASGTTTYCYDRRGNVTRKVQVTAGTTFTVSYTYTPGDRIATVTYPSGGIAAYGYDDTGRVNLLTWRSSAQALPETVVSGVSYYPFGPPNVLSYGNGRTLTQTYDLDYAIDSVVSSAGDGLAFDLDRDVMGNIVGASSVPGTTPPQRRYAYDRLHRLTRVDDASGSMLEDYGYNKSGDRTLKQFAGQAAQAYTYLAGTHRVGDIAGSVRSYDANGNTTDRGDGDILSYDARNRLAGVQAGRSNVSYDYSGRGERVHKTYAAGLATDHYVYDEAGQILQTLRLEPAPGGSVTESRVEYLFVYNFPVAQIRKKALSYIEADHLGTPRVAANPATNTREWRWDLLGSGFGEHAPVTDVSGRDVDLRYPGQWQDQETGLHYNYFRDYEPGTGRYVQADPAGLRGGGPQLYAYVYSAPLNWVDPDGLKPVTPDCCEKLKKVTDLDDSQPGANDVLWTYTYSPFSFSDDLLGLNCCFKSRGGPVDIDWMLRSAYLGAGRVPMISCGIFYSGKAAWNALNFVNPLTNMRDECKQNSCLAASYWINSGQSLSEMFQPALDDCFPNCK